MQKKTKYDWEDLKFEFSTSDFKKGWKQLKKKKSSSKKNYQKEGAKNMVLESPNYRYL